MFLRKTSQAPPVAPIVSQPISCHHKLYLLLMPLPSPSSRKASAICTVKHILNKPAGNSKQALKCFTRRAERESGVSAAHTLVRSDLKQAACGTKLSGAEAAPETCKPACQAVVLCITHLSGQIKWDRETSAHVCVLGKKTVCAVLVFLEFWSRAAKTSSFIFLQTLVIKIRSLSHHLLPVYCLFSIKNHRNWI